jgi:uncharacterized Zn-binding protein involved in type VI secretion
MPMAAMVTGQTGHLMTPLAPGPGCLTVLIGGFPAWRALPAGLGNAVESISTLMNSFMLRPAMTPVDATPWLVKISKSLDQGAGKAAGLGAPVAAATAKSQIASLNTANGLLSTAWGLASVVPANKPAADKAYTEGIKAAAAVAACAVIASMAGLSDMHNCPVPVPIPPHGPGYVTVGSATVVIGGLAAARQGDLVFEACGGPAPIAMGCPTVMIGDVNGGPGGGGGSAPAAGVAENAAGAAAGGAAGEAGGSFLTMGKLPSSIAAPVSASPVPYPSVPEPDPKRKVGDIQKDPVVRGSHPKSGHGDEPGTSKERVGSISPKK